MIELRGVTTQHDGGKRFLAGIGFSVAAGQVAALIGPNGAGKTTLLHCIAGVARHGGEVLVDGDDISRLSRRDVARRVALVAQRPTMPPWMTVREFVLLGRTPYIDYFGVESPDDLLVVDEVIAELQLDDRTGQRVGSLSGGEAQRASIARGLAQKTPVLLLDEPTSGLDPGQAARLAALVSRVSQAHGVTVVVSSHDLSFVSQVADVVLLLQGGRQYAIGPPGDLLGDHLLETLYACRPS